MHTAGEPLRIVLSGVPEPAGRTVLEKRAALKGSDAFRTRLMYEPRGHVDMYGALLVQPEREDSACGAIFLHNEGYSTMCGHAVLALARASWEGLIPGGAEEVAIDVPAGQVQARVVLEDGRYVRSAFRNVPSFADSPRVPVEVPGLGVVQFEIAYGGAFYAFVDAPSLGLSLVPSESQRLIDAGRQIKAAIRERGEPVHPFEPDLSFLYGVIFTGPPADPSHHSRHVCVFADGEVDRSPTGTGVSARAALLRARGEMGHGERIVIESILGTTFGVTALGECPFGPHVGVSTEVDGAAYFTGRSTFLFDPEDPLRDGFLLR